jgi:hypothetical protein
VLSGPKRADEALQVGDHQVGFLHGGGLTAAVVLAPVRHL